MGMAASQARLLSITARLSNNEMEQQSVAYSKQRLADNSEQANNDYLEALNKTKFQILTGYNGTQANYTDLTYAAITGNNTVACGKQYIVKTNKGQVLVSQAIADAFEKYNGDYNRFLSEMGYTQTDINLTAEAEAKEAIHEAWDRYLVSVGKGCYDEDGHAYLTLSGGPDEDYDGQHIIGFGFHSFGDGPFDGYATYNTATAEATGSGAKVSLAKDDTGYYSERVLLEAIEDSNCNTRVGYTTTGADGKKVFNDVENVEYDKDTKIFKYTNAAGEETEALSLYYDVNEKTIDTNKKNYLTKNTADGLYYSKGQFAYALHQADHALNFEGTTQEQRALYDYALSLTASFYDKAATADLKYDAQTLTYYKNIFNEMRTCGYTTLKESYSQKLATTAAGENMTSESKVFNDSDWMVRQLKAGNLTLAYYSIPEKGFVSTTMDDDESITEKEDSSAIKIAEQVYKKHMDRIEHQDKQFDLELTKLESEHNALQTEYDSVKKVISNNVEKSFNTFNA